MSVLSVEKLVKHFHVGAGTVHAVNGVSFTLAPGETLGLVGESGSGKSTIGRCVLRLASLTEGQLKFQEEDISALPERRLRALRGRMQIVFQDPWSALNPRMTARALIEEMLKLHTALSAAERRTKAEALGARVRLPGRLLDR